VPDDRIYPPCRSMSLIAFSNEDEGRLEFSHLSWSPSSE
jgi:hypothetical protein